MSIRYSGLGMPLIIAGLLAAPASATTERCDRAIAAQQVTRDTIRRETESYLACINIDGSEESCAAQFQLLSAAHNDMVTASWFRLMECG